MTVVVPHHTTQEAAKATLDGALTQLLAGTGNKNIQIVDPQKSWDDGVMTFSLTGKMGFISVPLAGTITVDDANVTVDCELPAMVKNFIGEEKVRGIVTEKLTELLPAA